MNRRAELEERAGDVLDLREIFRTERETMRPDQLAP